MHIRAKHTAVSEQQTLRGEKSSGPNWLKNWKTHVYKEKDMHFLIERDMKKKSTPVDSNKANAPTPLSIPSTKLGSSSNRLCSESKCPDSHTGEYPNCEYCWGLSRDPPAQGELLWCEGPTASMRQTANAFPHRRGLPYTVVEIHSRGPLQRSFSLPVPWRNTQYKLCISYP